MRRLEAESLYDTLLALAGRLDETPFGPPDPVDANAEGLVTARPTSKGWRRSIYILQRRTQVPTFLETFDLPRMGPNCIERPESTVAPQALHLLNNRMVRDLADSFARRIINEIGHEPARQVDRAYRVAFGRPPSDPEKQLAVDSLARLAAAWEKNLSKESAGKSTGQDSVKQQAADRALGNLCHAIMNSAELVYVD